MWVTLRSVKIMAYFKFSLRVRTSNKTILNLLRIIDIYLEGSPGGAVLI